MTRLAAAVLALVTLAGGASAAPTAWTCAIDTRGVGWIPEHLVLVHEAGGERVAVSDPLILYFLGAPVDARMAVENGRRLTAAWELRVESADGVDARMSYRATIVKGSGRVVVTATPLGFANRFEGRGRCRRQDG
jgi:hypothetical protein